MVNECKNKKTKKKKISNKERTPPEYVTKTESWGSVRNFEEQSVRPINQYMFFKPWRIMLANDTEGAIFKSIESNSFELGVERILVLSIFTFEVEETGV